VAQDIDGIERARDAVARESWAEAYTMLRDIEPSLLAPRDLEGLADATWWLSKVDESIAARQKAYAGYAAEGNDPRAAFMAGRLAIEHFDRGEPAVAMGWLMKAQRHLSDQPESVEHGFLALVQANVARFQGDLDGSMALAEGATRIGRRYANPDLIAMAIHDQGLVLVSRGDVREGMSLLDEAMTSVIAGEVSSLFTGVIYCSVLDACLDLADLGRAGEWNKAALAWCDTLPPDAPFTALCRINRAQLATLRGAWSEAETEARRVSEDQTLNSVAAARGFYETGEIRRRIGNLTVAEEAFARARELGLEPQPGLALLRLAQGKAEPALTALRLAVGGESENRPRRARLLAALVEVAVAAGDPETAKAASDDLGRIAVEFATPALNAAASTARGALALAQGDVPTALESLRGACRIWYELRLPYESARARVLYGIALRAAAVEDDAELELRAAISAFERLGAAPDAAATASLLAGADERPRGLTAREVEVLRLVASGKTNRDIAVELVISEHTVARHLQNIFAKLDVSSRSAATAFAFEHGLA
jgi:ATP/maltotriose-dependent transcriptional regulator MalT